MGDTILGGFDMDNKKIYNEIIKKMIKIENEDDLNTYWFIKQPLGTIEWLYNLLNEEGKKTYLDFCYHLFNRHIKDFWEEYFETFEDIDLVNDFIFSYCVLPDISFKKLVKAYSTDLGEQAYFLNNLVQKLNSLDLSLYKLDCNLIKIDFIPKKLQKK